jgi:histidinol-phosphate aminotransferase
MRTNEKYKNKVEYSICNNIKNVVNLGIIENFNPHYNSNFLPADINVYPGQTDEYNILLSNIASYTNVNLDQILITNGSGKGLDLILQTYTTQDSNILISVPNYPGFIHTAELSPGTINFFKYCGTDNEELDLELAIKKSNIAYFSSPNLPLGYSINYDKFKRYISENADTLFIIDEAYYEYGENKSFADLTNTCYNLVVTRTFSKAFALAGARIGYLIAHSDVIKTLRIGYNTKDITNVSISYALNVLENKKYYLNNVSNDLLLIEYINHELSKIIKSDRIIYDFSTFKAPWFLIKTTNPEYVCEIMKTNGYLVRNKSDDIPDCIRITLCTKEHIIKVINIIKTINTPYKHLYIDLDGTLRRNYTSLIPKTICNRLLELQKKYNITIVTDNSSNIEDIKNYLITNDVSCNLISPINKTMNPDSNSWFIFDDCIYILRFPEITPYLMYYINIYKKIRVIETDLTINSNELGLDYSIELPHIGSFLKLLKDPDVEIIGKSSLIINNPEVALVIGDSHNDETFAKNNKFNYIKVGNPNDTIKILNML